MRKFWTIVHRWIGLTTAIALFVAGATGAILAFYSELDAWLNADLMTVEARATQRVDLDTLAASVERALPNAVVSGLSVSEIPWRSVSVSPEGRIDPTTGKPRQIGITEAFVDPYDGRYLGARKTGQAGLGRREIMSFIYSLHYALHLPGVWGTWLMGGVAILWLFDNFVGAYLTFPVRHRPQPDRAVSVANQLNKGWWSRWKPAWLVKAKGSAYRITFDLHRAPGLWLWLVLAMLALSSVYLNLQREIFNPVVSLFSSVTPYPEFPKGQIADRRMAFTAAVDAARTALPADHQNLRFSFIGFDRETRIFRVAFGYGDAKDEWFKLRAQNIYIDDRTGQVTGQFGSLSTRTAGDTFNDVLFPLHSGQLFGLPGRIIICITGIAIAMLSITGVVIWLRKRRARKGRKQKAAARTPMAHLAE